MKMTMHEPNTAEAATHTASARPKISANDVSVFYGDKKAIDEVSIDIHTRYVTAFIGPSGCGKSTFLRTLNRMNDTISSARVEGEILLDGEDIYRSKMDVVQLRARAFPKTFETPQNPHWSWGPARSWVAYPPRPTPSGGVGRAAQF